jgi:predicted nucleic acid-binding protein
MMIFPRGQYHKIYTKIQSGDIVLVISNEILSEYLEILEGFYSQKVAEYTINAILKSTKNLSRKFGLL